MRAPANWAETFAPALVVLGLHAVAAHASRSGSETAVTAAPAATEVCESRTINYITHTLPQQCLRTSWTSPTPAAADNATVQVTVTTTATTVAETPRAEQDNGTAQEQDAQEELAASSFMSFEEWKEMMLRKSGQDPANIKSQKQREHRERDPAMNSGDADSFGEEGEISLDFDALAEKVSEITSSTDKAAPKTDEAVHEEQIFYDDGKTQYYRSKDAGKTCKERFSYASFDAGATVLKTSPGAKNAKAILVENKDSYMLLECRAKNKFVIVELSDDILVDTVVLANFEFFSSMIREFRVSVSDRYPVKLEKWVDLGTFEARNARDIQAFLIEHPQIYTKYIRIEFLSHWGNEFYCPVSLLRVHGTRMLDTWKEPSHDDEPEQIQGSTQEPAVETQQVQEPAGRDNSSVVEEETVPRAEMGLTPWQPIFQRNFSLEMCELRSPTTAEPTPVESGSGKHPKQPPAAPDSVTRRPSAASVVDEGSRSNNSSAEPASPGPPISQGQSAGAAPSSAPSTPPQASNNSTANNTGQKQSDGRADAADNSSSTTTTASRNKTSAVSSASASPTVQESFFKTITKRLQHLESNTSLSLQYIEEQSRFLQEVLLKMERKQITRVDSFLDTLNKTVLSELRNVRTQYDQIWQSTVLALETQREQSQREVVALTSRLNILADEVVFQKRMAILQSVLLLSCLVLVIFSRGGLAALDSASFPAFPPTSTAAAYRRYGYARSDSLSGISMPGSSPPHPNGPSGQVNGAAATNINTSNNNTNSLAASALPRHLYPTSSSPSSFKDKSLPLTPPSEYSRESTPATNHHHHLKRSPEPSFFDEQQQQQEEEGDEGGTPSRQRQNHAVTATAAVERSGEAAEAGDAGEAGEGLREAAETSSLEETDPVPTTNNPTPPPTNGQEQEAEGGGGEGGRGNPPLSRPRSAMPQLGGGGLRKPLPALPEDPS
ncbi:UNC-like C-terminal-domain-containing protein [Parachaetomium inaequale]|uniref:UNC-like C-terminal-domain-containing protein n=1 Tax=Parachaetomium inaequale TaxID=2588326 RepID=A0AAN6SRS7_9PEZI|nr:UNC-like C-terminal-domain-containing protein [Parachaetomium inaequale]